ncbi:hypothetical protein D9M70_268340 [compost metagenome]
MQEAHEVARGVVAASALVVLDLHHHARARRDYGGAFWHGDVQRIAALGGEVAVAAIGALGQAERAALPGQRIAVEHRLQARVAQGVTQFGLVTHGPGGIGRCEGRHAHAAARRQHPANGPVGDTGNVIRLLDAQFHFHRGEQLVAQQQGLAGLVLLRFQLHRKVQALDHAVAEDEYLGAGNGLVGIGHHTVGVGVLVDGQCSRRQACAKQQQQGKESPQHVGPLFFCAPCCRRLAARTAAGETSPVGL